MTEAFLLFNALQFRFGSEWDDGLILSRDNLCAKADKRLGSINFTVFGPKRIRMGSLLGSAPISFGGPREL